MKYVLLNYTKAEPAGERRPREITPLSPRSWSSPT